jgi:hypothetical protein
MYLEISARQTGKTKRMLLAVFNYLVLSKRNKVIIVSPNQVTSNYIDKWVGYNEKDDDEKYHDRIVNISASYFGETINGRSDLSNYMFVFDEFDFMNVLYQKDIIDNFKFIDKSYFVTTPRFLRNIEALYNSRAYESDLLVLLLKNNNMEYKHFVSNRIDSNYSYQQRAILPYEVFQTELMGHFLK